MADEVGNEDAADVFLGGSGGRAVVVGEVEVGDAAIKGATHHAAGFLEVVDVAEVVPEAEGDGREEEAGIAAAAVGHAAVVAGGVEHGVSMGEVAACAKLKKVTG